MPVNASAFVHLPASDAASVREGGGAAARAPGVSVLSVGGGTAVLSVGGGSYRFSTA